MSSAATITSTTRRARSISSVRWVPRRRTTRMCRPSSARMARRLSKRHGAVGVMEYASAGYLPEAMVNFLARIGWAHGDDEIFSRAELIDWFDLRGISPAPSRFNAAKLNWVNQEHMKRMPDAQLGQRLVPFLERAGLDPSGGPDPWRRGGTVARSGGNAGRDGRCRVVFLLDAVGPAGAIGRADHAGQSRRAHRTAWRVRDTCVDARSAGGGDQGRRRPPWTETGADHDAAAPAGCGNPIHACHRCRARAAGARHHARTHGKRALGISHLRRLDDGARSD